MTTTTKKTVLLRGPLLTASGYGVHSRQIARWLFRVAGEEHALDITTECLPWGNTHLVLDPEAEDGLIGEIVQAASNKKDIYDVTIQVQLPNEWNPFLGQFNVGVTAGVETDRCNPDWVTCLNRMDLVVVPSEFTKQCFEATGKVTTPVVVVPESFPDCLADAEVVPPALDLGLTTRFNFLVVGQLTGTDIDNDRKNIPYTLKWFADTFADCPDVGVILKTNGGANTQLDKQKVRATFSKLVGEITSPAAQGPKFYLLHGHMTDEEMKGLYTHRDIKALVSLGHGEGYGLPVLEAAVCGLPVVATNWSGYLDFMKFGKFVAVDRILTEVPPSRVDGQIFVKGAKWANPVEVDAKKRLRKFYESPQIPTAWAKELSNKLKERLGFDGVAKAMSNVLAEHLLGSP